MKLLAAAEECRLRIDGIGERQLLADDGVTPIYPGIPLGTASPLVVGRIADALWRDRHRYAVRTPVSHPPASALDAAGVMTAQLLRSALLGFGYEVPVWGAPRRHGRSHVVIEGPFPAAAAQQMAAALNVYDRLADVYQERGHD
ncbi:hypothetical protein [Streptomyces sp. NPDC059080]|uniref:hypothetical protein n=1 Tax=Streptomyces sp. NPDC059080 TaxID=3346718 RepID=UPI0036C8DA84